VKAERYVPGGGSKVVGAVVEEQAPMSSVQRMTGTGSDVFDMCVSLLSPKAEKDRGNVKGPKKGTKLGNS
jgi:hypothetical protein